ncbi:GNAT family N-acetyltransferase [Mammaliicoccus sciuri]|uniref:GNAT family N-acetyltransferase n=1 Tax=Mammaliicoccus sciuri TaxID=1296 RepID=UPI0021CE2867|nr:GNAT family N-acetyltransferase [Mammaliicoccus sciuri]UXU79129.1 GNAT family N-acetyltransferase [Mammaliicoccus sciuri]
MNKITISKSNSKNREFSNFLSNNIKLYNDFYSIYHKQSRDESTIKFLSYKVIDSNKKCLGGLYGEIYWDWFEIEDFWLDETIRGEGFGTKILRDAEIEAKEQGAKKILLTTFNFQGKSFYESHGYIIVGEIQDYPPGSSFFTMIKHL